jgi:uncharacterized membrane protein
MPTNAHLWAIGYDDMDRAEQVRSEVIRLGKKHSLLLLDTAVAVRHLDGHVTLDGEPLVPALSIGRRGFAAILAGLALAAPPLTGAAADSLSRTIGGTAADVGIGEDFVDEAQARMKLGTSALFVLDQADNMDAVLQGIRGLGGVVLKTNVDMERTRLVQSTLAAAPTQKDDRS